MHFFILYIFISSSFFFTGPFTCNSAFEQGHLESWCYITAFIIIITIRETRRRHINSLISQLDQNAVSTLKMCGRNKDGGHPLFVDGDGNCLFNALSVLSVSSRVLSVELRVRTCLELVTHGPVYKRVDSQDGLWKVSTKYDEECRDLFVTGHISSTWVLQAASTVVQRQITSVYPVMNGIRDEVPRILNRAFILL